MKEHIIHPVGGIGSRIMHSVYALPFLEERKSAIGIFWPIDDECPVQFADLFSSDLVVYENSSELHNKEFFTFVNPEMRRGVRKGFYKKSIKHFENFDINIINRLEDWNWADGVISFTLIRAFAQLWPSVNESKCPLDNDELQRYILRYFAPQEYLIDRVENFCKTNFRDSSVLGVHIRRTDNNCCIKRSPSYLFVDKIKQIEHKFDKIFISTDAPEEIDNFDFVRHKIVTFPVAGYNRQDKQHAIDGFVNLLILSKVNLLLKSVGSCYGAVSNFYGNQRSIAMSKN